MAMYTLNLLAIAMELAREDPTYEDVASKFWEHFIYIADAMNNVGPDNYSLWDDREGFYYDVLHMQDGTHFPIRVRSMVGLIPLFAVETLDAEVVDRLPGFKKRMQWFIENRPDLTDNVACMKTPGMQERRLLAVTEQERLRRVLRPTGSGRMLTLWEVAAELSRRLSRLFLRDEEGRRPVFGGARKFQEDPHWRDHLLFYEYFHGDNGAGLGASHQTGWTGLVAKTIQLYGLLDPKRALEVGRQVAFVQGARGAKGERRGKLG